MLELFWNNFLEKVIKLLNLPTVAVHVGDDVCRGGNNAASDENSSCKFFLQKCNTKITE